MNDCPLCENGIIVTVEYSLIGNPPERSGVPCWRCLTARAEKAEQELARVLAIVDAIADDIGDEYIDEVIATFDLAPIEDAPDA